MIRKKIPPAYFLLLGFCIAIIVGSILLSSPWATHKKLSIIDALFTSASAVCVTGLTVADTGSHFSTFGQTIIMLLIQIGGLGIMSFSSLIFIFSGKEMGLTEKMIIDSNFSPDGRIPIKKFLREVLTFSISVEVGCALLLYVTTLGDFKDHGTALYSSIFHAVSAFNNAGFSTYSNNLVNLAGHAWYNTVIIFLIISGGIGFLVIRELFLWSMGKTQKRISVHAKTVLCMTLLMILSAAIFIFFLEKNHSLAHFSVKDKVILSIFHSVTPRTAGFNAIPVTSFTSTTLLLIMLLMFIGASPGSTGGGIKTTTMFVLLKFFSDRIRGRPSSHLFRRKLPNKTVENAQLVLFFSLLWVFSSVLLIGISEANRFSLQEVLFEVLSALGTVGLSLGITPHLSFFSKMIIILTMLVGRIGFIQIMTLFYGEYFVSRFEYPEEAIMVG